MANNILKIRSTTPNTYRAIVKHFKEKKYIFSHISAERGASLQSGTQTHPLYY
jgi:hypothetical protein